MLKEIKEMLKDSFIWFPHQGYGYFPVNISLNEKNYFTEYSLKENDKIAKKIWSFRIKLIIRHSCYGKVLDIGIGSGYLEKIREQMTYGFDIQRDAIQFLEKKGKFYDPYKNDISEFDIIAFFDSLEHIEEPRKILEKINKKGQYVIVSIPIFRDMDHVMKSKHYKETEHFWYFTDWGFLNYMENFGLVCIEKYYNETQAGREDIHTYVFEKRGD